MPRPVDPLAFHPPNELMPGHAPVVAPARRFAYVTRTDDGNPSRAYWTWVLSPVENGTQVTVKWELHPKTFWRKTLFARIRHRQLKNEVRTSIGAVAAAVAARPGA